MIGTVQLILGHCPFLSLCRNWQCVIDIFSFVRFLRIFSLLSVMAHLLKVLFQETSLFSTARWIQSHSNFHVVCACGKAKAFAKFQLKSYEDVLEIPESFFKPYTVFPLTLAVSNIYDYHRATITQQQDFDLVV